MLGKNLAVAPLALALGGVMVVLLQVMQPMRVDHFLALLPQGVSMFLLFCMLANCLSILAPVAVAAGSMKAANFKGVPLLFHMGFIFLFPLAMLPTLLPLGVEALVEWLNENRRLPICLVLSVLECAAVVMVYRFVLPLEGALLQAREQKILETVTTKDE